MAPGGNLYKDTIESRTYNIEPKEVPSENSASQKAMVIKPGIGSNSTINDLLECPVCMRLMYPPIHQCSNGHTICYKCKSKIHDTCPICRQKLGNIRCIALEKVAELLDLPCKFRSFGCNDTIPHKNRISHEKSCRFRLYNCPYAGAECSVMGDIRSLVEHLKEDHGVDVHDGSSFNHRYVKSNPNEVENAMWMLTIFNCFGHQFCLHFEAFNLQDAPVYMAFLRFMGDEIEAQNFSYILEVGGKGRKMTWQGIPRSIRDTHKTVRDSLDGLIIQRNQALFFSGDGKELKLRVAGRIWRDQLEY